jgi:hypothetical protein
MVAGLVAWLRQSYSMMGVSPPRLWCAEYEVVSQEKPCVWKIVLKITITLTITRSTAEGPTHDKARIDYHTEKFSQLDQALTSPLRGKLFVKQVGRAQGSIAHS